jgi:hypothetical protein
MIINNNKNIVSFDDMSKGTPYRMSTVYYTSCCGTYDYEIGLDGFYTCSCCKGATKLVLDRIPVYIKADSINEFLEKLGFEDE